MSETRASAFEPGVLVGDRYRLGARLGMGGAGQIFEAVDERLDRHVAVKVVRTPELADRATLARLEREARAAARIRHPNIVDVTDFGLTREGYPFVVMERVDGQTLDECIAAGPLRVSLAIDLHVQLLDALAAAHAAGVLHRDVKPANLLVTTLPSGAPLVTLLDFGLAALAEGAGAGKLTDGGIVLGSPAYLAPERLMGREADVRSDVYAVGVSLFESLTGRRPFEAPSALVLRGRVLSGEAPSVSSLRPELAPALTAVVTRAMARDPEERFGTAAEMRDALRGLGRVGESTIAPRASVSAGASPAVVSPAVHLAAVPVAPRRASTKWAIAGLAAAAIAGGALWAASVRTHAEATAISTDAPMAVVLAPPRASPLPVTIAPSVAAPPTTSAVTAPPVDAARDEVPPRPRARRARAAEPTAEAPARVAAPAPAAAPAPRPTPAPAIDRPIEPVW